MRLDAHLPLHPCHERPRRLENPRTQVRTKSKIAAAAACADQVCGGGCICSGPGPAYRLGARGKPQKPFGRRAAAAEPKEPWPSARGRPPKRPLPSVRPIAPKRPVSRERVSGFEGVLWRRRATRPLRGPYAFKPR